MNVKVYLSVHFLVILSNSSSSSRFQMDSDASPTDSLEESMLRSDSILTEDGKIDREKSIPCPNIQSFESSIGDLYSSSHLTYLDSPAASKLEHEVHSREASQSKNNKKLVVPLLEVDIDPPDYSKFEMIASQYNPASDSSSDLSQSPLIRGLFNPDPATRQSSEGTLLIEFMNRRTEANSKSPSPRSTALASKPNRNCDIYCDVKVVEETRGPKWDRHNVFKLILYRNDDPYPKVIFHRYSDFVSVYDVLVRRYPFRAIPDLPPRDRLFGEFKKIPVKIVAE